MAGEKPSIDSVTTFVAELSLVSTKNALEGLQGRHTVRSLQAARRIAAQKKTVKIPRNLLRQLFRGTWGFKMEAIKASTEPPRTTTGRADHQLWTVQLGDLVVVAKTTEDGYYNHGPSCWLQYRGQWVAQIIADPNGQTWSEKDRANGFFRVGGVPYNPDEKKA